MQVSVISFQIPSKGEKNLAKVSHIHHVQEQLMTFHFPKISVPTSVFPLSVSGINTHLVLPAKDVEIILDLSITALSHTHTSYPACHQDLPILVPKYLSELSHFLYACFDQSNPGYHHLPWTKAATSQHHSLPTSTIASPSPFHFCILQPEYSF